MKLIILMVVVVALTGCGGSGGSGGSNNVAPSLPSSAPVISGLQYSPAYMLQQNGWSTTSIVNGSISIKAPDGNASKVSIQHIDTLGNYLPLATVDISSSSGLTPFSAKVTVNTDKTGIYNFVVSVIDAKGNESNKLNGSIEILAAPNFIFHLTTVDDNNTGLTWPLNRASPGPSSCNPGVFHTWLDANGSYISCLNANKWLGYSNWRMPTKDELLVMGAYSYFQVFFGVLPDLGKPYWSSSSASGSPQSAWTVTLYDIDTSAQAVTDKANLYPLWPVRDSR